MSSKCFKYICTTLDAQRIWILYALKDILPVDLLDCIPCLNHPLFP